VFLHKIDEIFFTKCTFSEEMNSLNYSVENFDIQGFKPKVFPHHSYKNFSFFLGDLWLIIVRLPNNLCCISQILLSQLTDVKFWLNFFF
jgi:hypothetical protein